MTTIDQIKKHYDKLTARERFALMMAALDRDDDLTLEALKKSAPRKVWSMPNTNGLYEAFQFSGMWYMLNQLGYMSSVYWIMDISNSDSEDGQEKTFRLQGESFSLDAFLDKLFKRILTNMLAWRRLCEEYKLDPDNMLKNYPHFDMMQLILLIIDGAAGLNGAADEIDPAEIDNTLAEMRTVIEKMTVGWE